MTVKIMLYLVSSVVNSSHSQSNKSNLQLALRELSLSYNVW